ncbi:hypothetical protein Taro_020510 [Colocasia esculenta]|uniref:Oxidoreductase n=1 Tax=Colocasia esculenta TaxID=4460 RepID=A0A843UWK6_COLES|nr:hypothetical protein [Colocasia esculenta]
MAAAEGEPIRFGILGCATIARKVARAIHLSPNAALHAVGSRSLPKARAFAAAVASAAAAAPPRAYGSYEEVLDDPAVEAVYVPLPTALHLGWAVAAAEKGKHVLLEKPAALRVSDLDRILEVCQSNGVQFMDGSMWLHHHRTARMRQFLSDPTLFGNLRVIHSTSTFRADAVFLEHNIRVKPDLDSLGALGDLGWYGIGAILWAADYALPATATALPAPQLNQAGVLLSCGASFHWHDGKAATFHSSFLSAVSMDLSVHGSGGSLQVTDLAIPFREDRAAFESTAGAHFSELHLGWSRTPEEVAVEAPLPQEAMMVKEFAELAMGVRDGFRRPEPKWGEVTRKTQLLVDAVKTSIELGCKTVDL